MKFGGFAAIQSQSSHNSIITSPFVLFYRGLGSDHAGRLITAILNFDFRELEWTHDSIQWLFPLVTWSGFNDHSPLLTEKDLAVFHRERVIRDPFRSSLAMMLEFCGFRAIGEGTLQRTERWEGRRTIG